MLMLLDLGFPRNLDSIDYLLRAGFCPLVDSI